MKSNNFIFALPDNNGSCRDKNIASCKKWSSIIARVCLAVALCMTSLIAKAQHEIQFEVEGTGGAISAKTNADSIIQ